MTVLNHLAGRTVMVVEDDWLIARYIKGALRSAGARIAGPAATAEAALAELDGRALPDAVTLDIRLRDGDSLPVARRLAELRVPFLFVSASAGHLLTADMRLRPRLTKPFAEAQLVRAVEALLRPAGLGPPHDPVARRAR